MSNSMDNKMNFTSRFHFDLSPHRAMFVSAQDDEAESPITSIDKKELLSNAMKRTNEWILSQEIESDVTVLAGGSSFSLHKFPLLSKSGYIRKLVSESSENNLTTIELLDIPGGSEAFELAAKFCYGINFDINTENVAILRCASEFLEMTEEYSNGNLIMLTEAYLTEVALKTLEGAVSILLQTESLLPIAENIKLVSRCVDMIAYITCKDSQYSTSNAESGLEGVISNKSSVVVDWWAEDLSTLRIDIFQRVVIAMMARGFKHYALGPMLMLYAQKSLRGLEIYGKGRKKLEPKQEHEKRVILETIVSLLPREKNAMSVSFLSTLLRAAIFLETTVACRLDLEKRMGLQLGQAVLDDLLIPSFSFSGDTLFDVDSVQRILLIFLENEIEANHHLGYSTNDEGFLSPPPSDMERVGKLMENYLTEIASDRNLSVLKFVSLAELIPEHSRVTEDGMYRSIDIFLKAHPNLSDLERKKVCSVMDCQKLSREACAHAAQNDRLPAQIVVQVLYHEQQRLRDIMSTGGSLPASPSPPSRNILYSPNLNPVSDELAILKRENQDLKFELLKMKMRLKEMEKMSEKKSDVSTPTRGGSVTYSADKPPLPKKSLISSVSKKLGKLMRPEGLMPSKGRSKLGKDRRHSIS